MFLRNIIFLTTLFSAVICFQTPDMGIVALKSTKNRHTLGSNSKRSMNLRAITGFKFSFAAHQSSWRLQTCSSNFARGAEKGGNIPSLSDEISPEKQTSAKSKIQKVRLWLWDQIRKPGRFLIAFAGRIAGRLPKRILRILIGGFVKELKSQQINLNDLHYILMSELKLEDLYRLVVNERSLNETAAEYGGLVNFLDAKAKVEVAKMIPGLDPNRDGDVTREEVVQFLSGRVAARLTTLMESVDTDGDGRISPGEVLGAVSDQLRDVLFQQKPPSPPR